MRETIQAAAGQAVSFTQSFSLDVLLILVAVFLFFGFTLRYGKEYAISLILALYIALLAFIYFPYKEKFLLFADTETQVLISNTLIFGVFIVLGYLAVAPLLKNRYASYTKSRWLDSFLLSLATTALFIAFSYHVLPIASIYTLDESLSLLFAPSKFFFWWLTAPLAVLFLAGRR